MNIQCSPVIVTSVESRSSRRDPGATISSSSKLVVFDYHGTRTTCVALHSFDDEMTSWLDVRSNYRSADLPPCLVSNHANCISSFSHPSTGKVKCRVQQPRPNASPLFHSDSMITRRLDSSFIRNEDRDEETLHTC